VGVDLWNDHLPTGGPASFPIISTLSACRPTASSRHWKRAHWLGYIEPRRFAANASLYRPQGQGCSGVPTPGRVQARHRWASSGTCSASMRSTTLGVAASSATRASHWSTITPLWTRDVDRASVRAGVKSWPDVGQPRYRRRPAAGHRAPAAGHRGRRPAAPGSSASARSPSPPSSATGSALRAPSWWATPPTGSPPAGEPA
jgi:hypothetical protein